MYKLYQYKYLKYKNKLIGKGRDIVPYIFQKLVFLGTNSGQPTTYRNVSSCCLTFINGLSWMFDCGEATQHQILKTSDVSAGNIEKIFITHLHGDHIYGLPGLIASISSMRNKSEDDEYKCDNPGSMPQFSQHSQFFEFYGPYGLAEYIRTVFNISQVCLNFKYRVNELIPPNWTQEHKKQLISQKIPSNLLQRFEEHPNYILSDAEGIYNLPMYDNNKINVQASTLRHSVWTFGYVITEPITQGSINMDKVISLGIKPGPELGKLQRGECVTIKKTDLDSGTTSEIVISPQQILDPPKQGRKLTILGDTSDNRSIIPIANNSDFLIHESTLKGSSRQDTDKAYSRGHSTAFMAGSFAGSINAKQLILNHFGSKFKPKSENNDMDELIAEAKQGYKQTNKNGETPVIITAEDFYVHNMSRK